VRASDYVLTKRGMDTVSLDAIPFLYLAASSQVHALCGVNSEDHWFDRLASIWKGAVANYFKVIYPAFSTTKRGKQFDNRNQSLLNTTPISRVVRSNVRILFLSSMNLIVHVLGTGAPSYSEPLNIVCIKQVND
jgi:hypothetical protein